VHGPFSASGNNFGHRRVVDQTWLMFNQGFWKILVVSIFQQEGLPAICTNYRFPKGHLNL
jgi:hypothetical protein